MNLRVGQIKIKRSQDDMRVPDIVLRCCGYVVEYAESDTTGETADLWATGFFVSTRPKSHPGGMFLSFVTAKHVVESRPPFTRQAFLVNSKAGGFVAIQGLLDHWIFHPTADVAVMPVNIPREADVVAFSSEGGSFLTPESIREHRLGIGDEVFMPGLFTFAPGNDRATPLLRYGNLAMLPDGPIQVDSSFAEVYLIEARSIGGISGSPVFIRETLTYITEDKDGKEVRLTGLGPIAYLLGLVHGHWDIKESEINRQSFIQDRQRGVNLGIAVVVPAHKILETINHPELVAMRESAERRYQQQVSPGPDQIVR